jgi:hypothetical protein
MLSGSDDDDDDDRGDSDDSDDDVASIFITFIIVIIESIENHIYHIHQSYHIQHIHHRRPYEDVFRKDILQNFMNYLPRMFSINLSFVSSSSVSCCLRIELLNFSVNYIITRQQYKSM